MYFYVWFVQSTVSWAHAWDIPFLPINKFSWNIQLKPSKIGIKLFLTSIQINLLFGFVFFKLYRYLITIFIHLKLLFWKRRVNLVDSSLVSHCCVGLLTPIRFRVHLLLKNRLTTEFNITYNWAEKSPIID